MARPRRDGQLPKPTNKRRLTPLYCARKHLEPGLTWDTEQRGLALSVQASGHRSYKCIYSFHGRPRWFTIADANAIGLADARKHARRVMNDVASGKDPAAERKAERAAGSFQELAARYVEEWSKKKNKSWQQGDALVRRYVLPRWAKLKPGDITRADVKAMLGQIERPVLQNQVLASASAVFSWAIRQEIIAVNPCKLVDRNETRSRERVLSDQEVPLFWAEFDKAGVEGLALKVILLTGQRPGEVSNLRREHIVDGAWWTLPGSPDPKTGWPGTKNGESHRVWLSTPVQALTAELSNDATSGFVFAGARGRPVRGLDAAMRTICADLGITDKVTPHDLRRTFSTKVTGLGFGRDALNRVTNHREGGIASVYDRHQYADENRRIMERVAAHLIGLAEGRLDSNVVQLARP